MAKPRPKAKTKTFHISDDLHYRIRVSTALDGERIVDFIQRALEYELNRTTHYRSMDAKQKSAAQFDRQMAAGPFGAFDPETREPLELQTGQDGE